MSSVSPAGNQGRVVRAIVLAAGKGTRMKSGLPKVLHEICGRPMLWHVLQALRNAGVEQIMVVSNPELEPALRDLEIESCTQNPQLGTGHAVSVALRELQTSANGSVLVACADMPLVGPELFRGVVEALGKGDYAAAMITARMPLPSSFGRVIRRSGEVERIVEVRDAAPDELAVDEMNAGIYAFREPELREAVAQLSNANAQNEYYLTDAIGWFRKRSRRVAVVEAPDHRAVLGINDRVELAQARAVMNARLCEEYMREGVTIIDPATTYLEPELRIGRDTVIYQNTSIGRISEIGEGCVLGPNTRLSNAKIGGGATIRESVVIDSTLGDAVTVGPFAHLRGESLLERGVKIGNFVEVKNSKLARDVKASHLSYLGDAVVGEDTNIGAGTITCNYDGVRKNTTRIGRSVFVGSNSSLVAPVELGDGSLIGASSVVTKDVPAGERVAGNPARPLPKKT